MDKELLSSGLERIGITPSDELIGRIQLYLDEILFFNPSLKLVGADDADEGKNAEDKSQYYKTYAYGRVTGYSLRIENKHLLRSAILESTSNEDDLDVYNTLNASSRTLPIWYFNTEFVVRIVALSIVFTIFVAFTISSITLFVLDKKKNKIA